MEEPDDRSRRCLLKASSMLGLGSRAQTSNDRRGICRFAIQYCSKGEHRGPNQCYTGSRQDDYSSVSGECSGSGTYRIAQAHQLDKVA